MGAALDGVASADHADDDGVCVTGRTLLAATRSLVQYPTSVLLAYAVPLLVAAPFAAMMFNTLTIADANGYPSPLSRGAVDVDRWLRIEQSHALLAGEFVPRTLGFAAAVDNLSALFEGPWPHGMAIIGAMFVHLIAWALLWPVLLTRWAGTRASGLRSALAVTHRFAGAMLTVSVVAGLAAMVLYLTLQPLLLDVVYPMLAANADSRTALVLRALCYLPFGALLIFTSVTADLARADAIVSGQPAWRSSIGHAVQIIRRRWGVVLSICSILLGLHLILLAGYGVGELLGGHRLGGWRAVAAAQLFVGVRVVLRLLWAASFLNLYVHESRPASR
jgi:hypothetical protein